MELVVKLLDLHIIEHTQQQPPVQQAPANHAPKMDRPHIDVGVDQESWLNFTRRWEAFKIGSCINESIAGIQLFQCASEKLGDLLLKSDPRLLTRSERVVLAQMESIAVIKVAVGITRLELMRVVQDGDEAFRTFATRVRGKAETCGFKTSVHCACGKTITADYTEEVIKDVILAGISDIDIRREVIDIQDIQSRSVNDIVSLVESREVGRHATGGNHSVAAVSTFKQMKRNEPKQVVNDKSKQIPCPGCNKMFFPFRKRRTGWNTKPFKQCLAC